MLPHPPLFNVQLVLEHLQLHEEMLWECSSGWSPFCSLHNRYQEEANSALVLPHPHSVILLKNSILTVIQYSYSVFLWNIFLFAVFLCDLRWIMWELSRCKIRPIIKTSMEKKNCWCWIVFSSVIALKNKIQDIFVSLEITLSWQQIHNSDFFRFTFPVIT